MRTPARFDLVAVNARVYARATRAEAAVRRFADRRADVDSLRVAYYDGGRADGPPVVLLHGYTADRTVWVRFAGHLRRDYRVIIPDLAGHGATPFVPGAGYSAPAQAARVVGLLDRLGIDRAHVLGNSMGGFVAATLARRHADRVRTLGLSDAAGLHSPQPSRADDLRADGRNPFLLDDPAQFPAFYAMTMAKPPFLPAPLLRAIAADYVRRRDAYAEIFDDFVEKDYLDDELGAITARTLVLWGTRDELVSPTAAGKWRSGIPRAQLITYDGVGHMPMVEIPRRTARDYRDFLSG